jgi:hypothetical protein
MGALRYGLLHDPRKWKAADGKSYDLMAGLQRKLDHYHRTGNTEALVDAGNYVMLLFMTPAHPNAHFRAEDDHNHCPTRHFEKVE